MYNICIVIVWDPEKALSNLRRHGVRFSDAESVLFDAQAITVEDESFEEERRFVSAGMDAVGRLLVVVYCYQEMTYV